MNIEVGVTYTICPKWKKSIEETEFYLHEDDGRMVGVTTLWRSGSFDITPQDLDEVEQLVIALNTDDEVFEPYGFEDCQLNETWDGCAEDLSFVTDKWNEEQQEEITEAHEEGEDFINEILESRGFYPEDMELFIHNGIMIEENGQL